MTALTRALGNTTPTTLNREKRTVEVIALSGPAPAVRAAPAPDGTNTAWVEELDAAGADLSRFRGGPALKDHRNTTDSQVGVVDSARAENGRIVATVRFSQKPAAEELMGDVADGITRGVSLGYRVTEWTLAGRRDGLPVYRATKWRPHELSFTPTPVDPGATIRSEETMTVKNPEAPVNNPAPPPSTPPTIITPDTPPAQTRATDTPLNRAEVNAQIRSIAKVAGLDQSWIDAQLDSGATVEGARALAFNELAKRGGVTINGNSQIQVGTDYTDPTVIRRSMADALAHRLAPGLVKIEGKATEFRGYRALDMVAELALVRGDKFNRFDPDAVFQRAVGAHSTGDFPLLLADVGNKILLTQYQAAAPTYRRWAARRSFSDFRAYRFLRIGDFPAYKSNAEGGGVKYGTLSENRETVQADEFTTGLILGRKLLMSDELHALGDFSSMIAIRTAADENRMVYSLLNDHGPELSDGKTLFHADHGNKSAAGTGINVTSVSDARTAMREQTSLDGIKLNIEGAFLLCGSKKELEARQVLANITPAKTSDVNPWSGAFEPIIDSNITGNRWHLLANPAMYPTIVYGYVAGSDGPQIKTEIDFDTQAVKIRAGLDFGCGAIDFRGAYLNQGN